MKFNWYKLVAIIVAVLAFIVIVGSVVLIYPFYSDSVNIVEKTIDDYEIPDKTIEVELPNIEEISENSIVNAVEPIYKEEQKEDEIINILISGVDTRGSNLNSLSDVIILASYNKTKHEVKLVSFMRDTWIHIPDRGWSRINAATAYGGTGLLINTLNENFDLDIQSYIQVRFKDFKEIIDTLGGIEVELSKQEINYINNKLHSDDNDWNNDIKAEPGLVRLNGVQALWHCRNRSIGNGDYERTDRQREVLGIILNRLLEFNADEIAKLILLLRDKVSTNIPADVILELAYDALTVDEIPVESHRIPFEGLGWSANKNGASVLEIDIDKSKEKLHEILGYEAGENLDG